MVGHLSLPVMQLRQSSTGIRTQGIWDRLAQRRYLEIY